MSNTARLDRIRARADQVHSEEWYYLDVRFLLDEIDRNARLLKGGGASDGFHTHNELYDYRMVYNAALFNEWHRTGRVPVCKSLWHSDGEPVFGGTDEWFIVVATLPTGQISNHYRIDEAWDLFQVPDVRLPPEYDGHTPAQALKRLWAFIEEGTGQ